MKTNKLTYTTSVIPAHPNWFVCFLWGTAVDECDDELDYHPILGWTVTVGVDEEGIVSCQHTRPIIMEDCLDGNDYIIKRPDGIYEHRHGSQHASEAGAKEYLRQEKTKIKKRA